MKFPSLTPSTQTRTPLAHTTLEVEITDLVAESVVCHAFRNTGSEPIEAVFTFPIPLDAAFLGMRATIAGKTHVAAIQAARKATRAYDNAITDGHSAALLRAPEPGVLNLSLGNLLPGEDGEIELRFAQALGVADGRARFGLPLVHRPRYGSWNIDALDQPTHDFAVEHPLSATIRVRGLLATASVHCATHSVAFQHNEDGLELRMPTAMLDRDLVLGFELTSSLPQMGRCIMDDDATLGVVTIVLPDVPTPPTPLDVCILLDGSGSMSGEAIAQSRAALRALSTNLAPEDAIQVLRFGSDTQSMFRRPLRATEIVRRTLVELADTVNADLGGTEIGMALETALQQLGAPEPGRRRAIILVTDGAVQPRDVARAQKAAVAAGVRIFVIAVGGSAGTEVLAPLAHATRGQLERAVPAEPIDAGVLRQLRRARRDRIDDLRATWSHSEAEPIAMPSGFPGEAVMVVARLPAVGADAVQIRSDHGQIALDIALPAPHPAAALRALIGQRRHDLATKSARPALALRYGLLTQDTAAVLVAERAGGERATSLPVLVPVAQMVPNGMVAGVAFHLPHPELALLLGRTSCVGSQRHLGVPRFQRRPHAAEMPADGYAKKAAPAPMPMPMPMPMPIRTDLETLAQHLRDILRICDPGHLPTLADALATAPCSDVGALRAWLEQAGVAVDVSGSLVPLLRALIDALNLPKLNDDEEALVAILRADCREGAANSDERRTLLRAIDRAIALVLEASPR